MLTSAMAETPKDLRGKARGNPSPDHERINRSMTKSMSPREIGTFVQTLQHGPFPYSGKYEDTTVDFFDTVDPQSGHRFHTNRYGDRYSEKDHYSDGRVLFHVPSHFDPRKPFAYVLYFHGLGTDSIASNRDYELTRQIDLSGRNVILVVPQLGKTRLPRGVNIRAPLTGWSDRYLTGIRATCNPEGYCCLATEICQHKGGGG